MLSPWGPKCRILEETVSQDLLTLVKPPIDPGKLPLPAAKPAEKPAEDFLAVLDRALSAKTENAEAARPAVEQTIRDEAASEAQRAEENRRPASPQQSAELVEKPKEPAETAGAAASRSSAQNQAVQNQANDTPGLASARLEKTHGRQESVPAVQNLPKHDVKPRISVARADQVSTEPLVAVQTMAQTLSAQGLIQRNVSAGATASKPAPDEVRIQTTGSRKLNHKTNESDASEKIGIERKKLSAAKAAAGEPAQTLAAKKPAARPASGEGEVAAAKMQLHADTGGTKGLADALSLVKNLADKMGIGGAQDSVALASKTIDLSRMPLGQGLAKAGQTSQHGAESTERTASHRNSRVEVLRAERLGRRDGGEVLQQAADRGRVQVVDRSSLPRSSLVLESMRADKSRSGQAGRGEEGKRNDSLQLINTSFLNPAAERNTVSIPIHLVASQQGNLQQALRSHLAEKGNSDIVQQARIIMNGQDSGEIKLILKPENLGEVRINLQMQDGHIAGQIFVENKEVQAAFQDNLDALMQAFQDGGLEMGAMQVTVDPNAGRQNGQSQQQFAEDRSEERRKIHAVRSLENSVATVSAAESAYSQINLVV